jgi:hypothetical protein
MEPPNQYNLNITSVTLPTYTALDSPASNAVTCVLPSPHLIPHDLNEVIPPATDIASMQQYLRITSKSLNTFHIGNTLEIVPNNLRKWDWLGAEFVLDDITKIKLKDHLINPTRINALSYITDGDMRKWVNVVQSCWRKVHLVASNIGHDYDKILVATILILSPGGSAVIYIPKLFKVPREIVGMFENVAYYVTILGNEFVILTNMKRVPIKHREELASILLKNE